MDRNRLRSATLVPGFRLSRAAAAPAPSIPGTSVTRCPKVEAAAGSRPLRRRPRVAMRPGCSRLPAGADGRRLAVASRREKRPSRGLSGDPLGGQPDCNPMWPRLRQRFRKVPDHQYSNLTVTVVRRGATGGSPTEGSGLSRGGTPWGTRSSEEVRRPHEAVGRRFPGGPTTRAGAPFAPLSASPSLTVRIRALRCLPSARPVVADPPGLRTAEPAAVRCHRVVPRWPGRCTMAPAPLLSI